MTGHLQSFTIGVGQILDTSGSYGVIKLNTNLKSCQSYQPYRPCGVAECADNVKGYIRKAFDVKLQEIDK